MRRLVLPCVALAAAMALTYLAVSPASADLAAAIFRSGLFAREGFVVVDPAWYGGHDVPSYSVLMPPLGALLGPRVVAALAVVAAAGLFPSLISRCLPRGGVLVGALWFAAGVAAQLLTGRVAFLLGVPFGLGALLAAQRGHRVVALGLGVLTALASPVAAAFLALTGVAWTIGAGRRLGLALAAAALVPVVVLATVFPQGGTEPFVASAFWPALVALVALAIGLPRRERVLRAGAALYAVAALACFLLPTAVGGNVTRLAALVAGPLVAALLWGKRPVVLAVVALPLLYWQLMPPVRDVAVAAGDPSTRSAYYEPLIDRLARERPRGRPIRVEIPFTRAHWEAALLARHVAIARGWERQLDRQRNALFYDGVPLTAARYQAWLHQNAIDFVALPDVALDDSAKAEARLIRAGVPDLHRVWRGRHWTLYRVAGTPPIGVSRMETDGFALPAGPRRTVDVRVRFSPHWAVIAGAGCVSEASHGYTRVRVTRPGSVRVGIRIDVSRALLGQTGPRCTPPLRHRRSTDIPTEPGVGGR